MALTVDEIFLERHFPLVGINPGGNHIVAHGKNLGANSQGMAKIARYLAQRFSTPQPATALQM